MSSMIYKRKSPLLIFLIPAFLFLLVFLYYPFVQNIINTFLKIGGLGRRAEGLNEPWYENYARLFTDPYMRVAFKNTLILTVCTVVFQVGIALILALLVDTIRVGAQFFRTVYFFPIVISATALGLMFNLIFLYKGGMVNQLLLSLGALETKTMPSGRVVVTWLDWKDQAHFLFTMFLPVMWLRGGCSGRRHRLDQDPVYHPPHAAERALHLPGTGHHGLLEGVRPALGHVRRGHPGEYGLAHRHLHVRSDLQ